MSELKPYTYDDMIDGDADTNIEYYPKSDADAIIAQKDFEIDRLKEFNAFLKQRISNGDVGCSIFLDVLEQKDKEIAELKKKLMPCLNGDCILTCEVVEKYGKENAELKRKLENVKASMYCDVVDANMENRRLKRALWLARAYRAKEMCQRLLIQGFDPKWEEVERKCRAKAEEYK